MAAMPGAVSNVVLVVDDDPQIQKLVADYLSKFEYSVAPARSRAELFEFLELRTPCLIILDLHLPDGIGFDIAREIRTRYDLPLVILTGSQDEYDRIVGLEVGADDFMSKPFAMRELLARIRAVLRRYTPASSRTSHESVWRFGGWNLNLESRLLRNDVGVSHKLTDHEFRLLKVMLDHPHRVLSRDFLLEMGNRLRTTAKIWQSKGKNGVDRNLGLFRRQGLRGYQPGRRTDGLLAGMVEQPIPEQTDGQK